MEVKANKIYILTSITIISLSEIIFYIFGY